MALRRAGGRASARPLRRSSRSARRRLSHNLTLASTADEPRRPPSPCRPVLPGRPAVTWRDTTIDYAEFDRSGDDGRVAAVGRRRTGHPGVAVHGQPARVPRRHVRHLAVGSDPRPVQRPPHRRRAGVPGRRRRRHRRPHRRRARATATAAAAASWNARRWVSSASTASWVRRRPTRPTSSPATSPGSSTRRAPRDIRKERCCRTRSCIS